MPRSLPVLERGEGTGQTGEGSLWILPDLILGARWNCQYGPLSQGGPEAWEGADVVTLLIKAWPLDA